MITETATPTTARARRKLEQREELLDRALDLFAEHGPTGLTIRQLAKELGLSSGALYRYVSSKDELLAQVQMRAHATVHDGLIAAIESAPDDTIERIRAAARFYISLPEKLPRESRLLQFLIGDPRPILAVADAAVIVPSFTALLGDVSRLFSDAVAAGTLNAGDAIERATCFWSALQGAQTLRKLARFDARAFDSERASMEIVSALLLRWGAAPAALLETT